MTVYIVDPSLIDETGHHFNAALAIFQEARASGEGCRVIANRAITQRAKDALAATPHFPRSVYGRLRYTPMPTTDAQDFGELNRLFCEDLLTLPIADLNSGDCLIFPTIVQNQLLGLANWLSTLGSEKAPTLAIYLIVPPLWRADDGLECPEIQTYYKAAFRRFPPWAADKVMFITETEQLQSDYEPLCPFPIITLPLSTMQRKGMQSSEGRGTLREHPRIVFPGYASEEKGFHLLPSIIQLVLTHFPTACFAVQANTLAHSERTRLAESQLLRAAEILGGKVMQIHAGALSTEEYAELLATADILLLPYDPTAYGKRGSGVVREGARSGVPMVVPRKTAIGEFAAAKGAAMLFDEHTPQSIASAVVLVLRNLAAMKKIATEKATSLAEDGDEAEISYRHILRFHRSRQSVASV